MMGFRQEFAQRFFQELLLKLRLEFLCPFAGIAGIHELHPQFSKNSLPPFYSQISGGMATKIPFQISSKLYL